MAKKQNLVIVESPGKIRKIQDFLGKDYKVVASYGHVRDLDKGANGIDKKNNFQPNYIISPDKKDVVKELAKLVKESDMIYLAQDQDREGEAISWHLKEVLHIPENRYERIVFQEITKKAIEEAIEHPRKIDMDLVNAQQARRVLDRLVGFDLSPLLWKKIQMGLSAGRVQSVAVKLIAEKEKEINAFETSSDFKVIGLFIYADKGKNIPIKAVLNKRFQEKEKAREFLEKCIGKDFFVTKVEKKPSKKSPPAPFSTSTMQQIANRNLGFSVDRTMKVAQKLYEGGHITYMRTDSVILSEEILEKSKAEIEKRYSKKYAFSRQYKNKSKSAQEAHEAIRPTHIENDTIDGSDDENRLYELIWVRTMASQMADAEIEKTIVSINTKSIKETFVANGEVIKFDGFLKVYRENTENETDEDEKDDNKTLPALKENDKLDVNEILALETFKRPSPRYSESSLVKKMEELGIGRPSTYAMVISTIQKRNYVQIKDSQPKERIITTFLLKDDKISESSKKETYGTEKKKMFPTDIGMVVNDFLTENFDDVVNYNFTANVENDFDEIASGNKDWIAMITEFYNPFHEKVKVASNEAEGNSSREIGRDPLSGKMIVARIGKFGPMIQMGKKDDDEKPKFAKLKENQSISTITLEEALDLLRWPREIGNYKKESIIASIGKYGPYIKYKGKFHSLKELPAETITLNQAIEVINESSSNGNGCIKKFDKQKISVLNGKFGPYISQNGKNYSIPASMNANSITLAECLDIIKKKYQKTEQQ